MKNSKPAPITVDPTGGEILSVVGGNYRILISAHKLTGHLRLSKCWCLLKTARDRIPMPIFMNPFILLMVKWKFIPKPGFISQKRALFVIVPEGGIVNYFKNVSDKMAQLLCTVVPAGLEEFFEEIGEPTAAGEFLLSPPMDPEFIENLQAIAQKHGQIVYPPNFLD